MSFAEMNGVPRVNGVTVPVLNGHTSSYAAKHNLAAHFIGGNHLAAAPPGPVKDFVADHDGHTVITSVCHSSPQIRANREMSKRCVGPDRQQWNCSSQGNPVGAEMGL